MTVFSTSFKKNIDFDELDGVVSVSLATIVRNFVAQKKMCAKELPHQHYKLTTLPV